MKKIQVRLAHLTRSSQPNLWGHGTLVHLHHSVSQTPMSFTANFSYRYSPERDGGICTECASSASSHLYSSVHRWDINYQSSMACAVLRSGL